MCDKYEICLEISAGCAGDQNLNRNPKKLYQPVKPTQSNEEYAYLYNNCRCTIWVQFGKEIIIMETIREVASVVFKALTLAVGVAVVVLSRLGNLDVNTAVSLLGIGLACAGIALLSKP